jgi:uncharacterized protein (TIGR00725 family)
MAGMRYVAVCGPGEASAAEARAAEEVGAGLARARAILVTGGLGGVMEAASRGAGEAGGCVIALLPGLDRAAANRWATIIIPTGLGELRNGLIVRCADAIVAIGGAFGTLSELALALKAGKPVIGLHTWSIEGIEAAASATDAVVRALRDRD